MTMNIRTVWHPGLEKGTYEEHRDIIALKGKVYWCVIHDGDYPSEYKYVLDEHLTAINKQIKSEVNTYLFIETRDPYQDYFCGKIAGPIIKGNKFKEDDSRDLIPSYYKSLRKKRKDLLMSYWILLSDLRKISPELFRKARPVEHGDYESNKYGKHVRPYPSICDFEAEGELIRHFESQKVQSLEKTNHTFKHSPDYRSINLDGIQHSITGKQAQVVEILHKAWKNGTPDVSNEYILEELDLKSSNLKDIFRSRKEDMKKIVVHGKTKGSLRLNI
jgi:hypothetical protein